MFDEIEMDTSLAVCLILGAVASSDVAALTQANAIDDEGGWYAARVEEFEETDPELAAAFDWLGHMSPDQRRRLLVVPRVAPGA